MTTTTLPALDGLAQWLRHFAGFEDMHSMGDREAMCHWASAVESLEAALAVPAQQGEGILKLPAVGARVETGAVQFGDDWPGVFIRGDNAFGFIGALEAAIAKFEPHTEGLDFLTACMLAGLRDTLASSDLTGISKEGAAPPGTAAPEAEQN
jgi:hypothetical protein